MKRKFLLLMIVSMLLTGCYDKTETEERLYVVLMGIDGKSIPESYDIYGDEGRYIVSVGEAKLESDIGDDSEDQKTVIVSGNTFSEIKQTADKYSDKEIYFGQLKAAVLGADIIKDSDKLAETVYNIERMDDINTKVVVFASEKSAAEAVESVMAKDSKGGLYLWDYYKNNDGNADADEYMDFENLVKCMREDDTFIIPKITADESQILLDGGYVIKKGEFMGEITDEDIKSIKWFEGKAKGELINDNELSARVKKARISIADENGVAVVSIKAECSIENGISESIKYSQDRLETVIKSNLENTINKARKLNADFIGLTDGDGMGSKSFKINVEVKIISTGVIK